MADRTIILIDGGHLDALLCKEFDKQKIDYMKLVLKLSDQCQLLRTYYYTCEPYQSNPPTDDERRRISGAQRFHHYLQNLPNFEVRLGRLAHRGTDSEGKPILEQKQVDILMSLDLIRMSFHHTIQKAVLVTGDSDFVPVIKAAKDEGMQVIIYHGLTVHQSLLDAVDAHFIITRELIEQVKR